MMSLRFLITASLALGAYSFTRTGGSNSGGSNSGGSNGGSNQNAFRAAPKNAGSCICANGRPLRRRPEESSLNVRKGDVFCDGKWNDEGLWVPSSLPQIVNHICEACDDGYGLTVGVKDRTGFGTVTCEPLTVTQLPGLGFCRHAGQVKYLPGDQSVMKICFDKTGTITGTEDKPYKNTDKGICSDSGVGDQNQPLGTDFDGQTCADWVGEFACTQEALDKHDFALANYSQYDYLEAEMKYLQRQCPMTCGMCSNAAKPSDDVPMVASEPATPDVTERRGRRLHLTHAPPAPEPEPENEREAAKSFCEAQCFEQGCDCFTVSATLKKEGCEQACFLFFGDEPWELGSTGFQDAPDNSCKADDFWTNMTAGGACPDQVTGPVSYMSYAVTAGEHEKSGVCMDMVSTSPNFVVCSDWLPGQCTAENVAYFEITAGAPFRGFPPNVNVPMQSSEFYLEQLRANCPASCGLCGEAPTEAPSCKDAPMLPNFLKYTTSNYWCAWHASRQYNLQPYEGFTGTSHGGADCSLANQDYALYYSEAQGPKASQFSVDQLAVTRKMCPVACGDPSCIVVDECQQLKCDGECAACKCSAGCHMSGPDETNVDSVCCGT